MLADDAATSGEPQKRVKYGRAPGLHSRFSVWYVLLGLNGSTVVASGRPRYENHTRYSPGTRARAQASGVEGCALPSGC
jgi:hypothetical protein